MTKIRLIIAGSRTVDPTDEQIDAAVKRLVEDTLGLTEVDDYHGPDGNLGPRHWIEEVICGKADGADAAGARWTKARGIPVFDDPVTEEDRKRWGPYDAPKRRNRRMAERGTHAVVFWNGMSGGSADMATRMLCRGRPVLVIPTKNRPRKRRVRQPRGL